MSGILAHERAIASVAVIDQCGSNRKDVRGYRAGGNGSVIISSDV